MPLPNLAHGQSQDWASPHSGNIHLSEGSLQNNSLRDHSWSYFLIVHKKNQWLWYSIPLRNGQLWPSNLMLLVLLMRWSMAALQNYSQCNATATLIFAEHVYQDWNSVSVFTLWLARIWIAVGSKLSQPSSSGKHPDSDKAIYSFKIYEISIITIRITYHQIKLEKGR